MKQWIRVAKTRSKFGYIYMRNIPSRYYVNFKLGNKSYHNIPILLIKKNIFKTKTFSLTDVEIYKVYITLIRPVKFLPSNYLKERPVLFAKFPDITLTGMYKFLNKHTFN